LPLFCFASVFDLIPCFLIFNKNLLESKMEGNRKFDLVLVGTGFASSFFLKKYLEKTASNKKVLVLERGRFYAHKDRISTLRGNKPEYYQFLESHENTLINYTLQKPWVFDVNFGGSSNCWWGSTPRFMPNDFKLNTMYGRGQDWPISYQELEKYYGEAEEIMGVAGPSKTPYPRSSAYPLPAHALSTVDKKMQLAYGDNWISQPTARASVSHGNRNACCTNYSCSVCPVNAKFTIENTLINCYQDPRVEVQYGMQALYLEFEKSLAKSVVCASIYSDKTIDFPTYTFDGEVIALGTNAIFNAHILLNSRDQNPFLGVGLCDQRGFYANMHIDMDNVGGGTALTAHGYLQYDGDFRKEGASCLIENHNGPFIRNERGKWRKLARFKFVFEDLPQHENRVKASADFFKPIVQFKGHSHYVEAGRNRILTKMLEDFKPLPIEDIFVDDYYQNTESHLLSTVRMGKDISNSVVDKFQKHHRYRNLFVLGGSSFPTVAAANPSLTISALSLMSADQNF
jgi:choline dehydrogenase-like flavoprotein